MHNKNVGASRVMMWARGGSDDGDRGVVEGFELISEFQRKMTFPHGTNKWYQSSPRVGHDAFFCTPNYGS